MRISDWSSDVCSSDLLQNPLDRGRVLESLDVGVRAINGLLTIGQGQRVGIIAGSGVGKSVLLGMIVRAAEARWADSAATTLVTDAAGIVVKIGRAHV